MVEALIRSQHQPLIAKNLAKVLFHDFRLSFRFSQGSEAVQDDIYNGLLYEYTDKGILPFSQTNQEQVTGEVKDLAATLSPPAHHSKNVSKENIEKSSTEECENFLKYLTTTRFFEPDDKLIIHQRIGRGIISRDAYYVYWQKGRPHAIDPKASYFREYVLNRKRTGSLAFDAIFKYLQEVPIPSSELHLLVDGWKQAHSGQPFYPDGIDIAIS